jgi:hypothetical protein
MSLRHLAAIVLAVASVSACRTGTPVMDRGTKPVQQDGTIAGHVRSESGVAVVSRVVRAVEVTSGRKYETTTNAAGTFTLKVPPGRYTLDVELRAGERLAKQPAETTVNSSDLDPDRDFVIAVSR